MELKPCEGCGLLPVNIAPPQARGKVQYQCVHFAGKDREKITSECWGMYGYTSVGKAVETWNAGKTAYLASIQQP